MKFELVMDTLSKSGTVHFAENIHAFDKYLYVVVCEWGELDVFGVRNQYRVHLIDWLNACYDADPIGT